jgi:hypothetical protein
LWLHTTSSGRVALVEFQMLLGYPRAVARKRPQPSRPPSPPADHRDAPGHGAPEQERYGPLVISRHRKDDGRALILYEHATEPER